MSGLFDIIRVPFGFLIKWLYNLCNNYFVAILIFSILLKLVMFPFGIKQQKNSQKQASLRPKENIIRKKYAGRTDRATQLKMNTEIQELYQKENFSPLGGCLPLLVSMIVLLSVFGVVRSPLQYMADIPTVQNFDTADAISKTVTYMVFEDEKNLTNYKDSEISKFLKLSPKKDSSDPRGYTNEEFWEIFDKGGFNFYAGINSITYIKEHKEEFIRVFDRATHYDVKGNAVSVGNGIDANVVSGEKIASALPELELFDGFDLGTIPNISLLSEEKIGQKLLLLIPVLNLVFAYFGQALTRKYSYQPEQAQEVQNQTKMMNIFMPLMSFFIAYSVPSAVGIYWMISSLLSPVQQIVLSKMYPIKEITPEEMREAERLYGGKQKKKKGTSSNPNGKKRKSLVYDDDDEFESVSRAPEKKVLMEKKEDEASVVEKAPLKED